MITADVGLNLPNKGFRLNQDAELVAIADACPGEVGAAKEDFVAIHQNDFFVQGAVFLNEADDDAVVLQGRKNTYTLAFHNICHVLPAFT